MRICSKSALEECFISNVFVFPRTVVLLTVGVLSLPTFWGNCNPQDEKLWTTIIATLNLLTFTKSWSEGGWSDFWRLYEKNCMITHSVKTWWCNSNHWRNPYFQRFIKLWCRESSYPVSSFNMYRCDIIEDQLLLQAKKCLFLSNVTENCTSK